jgi:hypothetical protein
MRISRYPYLGEVNNLERRNPIESQKEALNPVKLFFQARHAFRIPQRLFLSQMTRRGVTSCEIVTFVLFALFMGAPSVAQMPHMVAGMITMVSTSCIYLWLKDPRLDSRKLLRMPFLNGQGINFIDDTYCLCEGIHIDGVSIQRDPNTGLRSLGHAVVALYQWTKGRCGFVDFAISVSRKRPKGVGSGRLSKPIQEAKDKKKWEIALELLERSKVTGICVFDSFYCCLGFLLGLGKLHMGFVGRVAFHWRRRFLVDGIPMTAREFFDSRKNFKRDPKTGVLFCQWIVIWPGLGEVKLVCVKFFREGKKRVSNAILVTDQLDWFASKVIATYLMRPTIEQAFKELKQCFMLQSYHLRSWQGIVNYMGLSMLTYNMAAWMRSRCGFAIPTLVTLFRRYAVIQQAHQLAQAHIVELSADIEATLAMQPMVYEQLKPILRRYHSVAPELPMELPKCA